jgi:hypothetical protein
MSVVTNTVKSSLLYHTEFNLLKKKQEIYNCLTSSNVFSIQQQEQKQQKKKKYKKKTLQLSLSVRIYGQQKKTGEKQNKKLNKYIKLNIYTHVTKVHTIVQF